MDVYTLQTPLDPEMRARVLLEDERDQLLMHFHKTQEVARKFIIYQLVSMSLMVAFIFSNAGISEFFAFICMMYSFERITLSSFTEHKYLTGFYTDMKRTKAEIMHLNRKLKGVATK